MDITITMKDGTKRIFKDEPRAGGSYHKSIRYEGAFAIVKDEYYRETAIPVSDIAEIATDPHDRSW